MTKTHKFKLQQLGVDLKSVAANAEFVFEKTTHDVRGLEMMKPEINLVVNGLRVSKKEIDSMFECASEKLQGVSNDDPN